MSTQHPNRINARYVSLTFIAVLSSWILHEFAHWLTGTLLHYKMGMSLNKTFPLAGTYASERDYHLISAAGPLITLLEAGVIFFLMQRHERRLLYPFLFACFYMRFFALIISFRRPNDEARISSALGLGTFTLPLIVTGILFVLLYRTSRQYQFPTSFNAINFGLILLFSSVIIMADQYFNLQLI